MSNAELTIDPIQLKIISRFIAQINQFQKVLRGVMGDLGLEQSVNLERKPSKSNNNDLFSSIIMTFEQPSRSSKSTE